MVTGAEGLFLVRHGNVAAGIAALGEERAGGVQNLLSRADLGGLAAVQAGLDSEGGDGICHIIKLLLYFRPLVGADPAATSNEYLSPWIEPKGRFCSADAVMERRACITEP